MTIILIFFSEICNNKSQQWLVIKRWRKIGVRDHRDINLFFIRRKEEEEGVYPKSVCYPYSKPNEFIKVLVGKNRRERGEQMVYERMIILTGFCERIFFVLEKRARPIFECVWRHR